jgi:hypothetical protein
MHRGCAALNRNERSKYLITDQCLSVATGQLQARPNLIQVRSGEVYTRPKSKATRVRESQGSLGYLRGIDGFESSYARKIDVPQHSLANDQVCDDTSDSESAPKNGRCILGPERMRVRPLPPKPAAP